MAWRNPISLIGKTFGRLTVTKYITEPVYTKKGKKIRGSVCECKCSCGESVIVQVAKLKTGNTKSCGCYRKEMSARRRTIHGATVSNNVTERSVRYLTYRRWWQMVCRCHDPKNHNFERYSSRGITVCDRWVSSFQSFLSDMGDVPSSAYTLDRIDNDKGYSPDNCRWATALEQVSNRECTVLVSVNGETKSLAEWCRIFEKDYRAMYRMIVERKVDPELMFGDFGDF